MCPYRYVTQPTSYEDFAAGRVLYNLPGATSFPVRLASEIFQHALHLLDAAGAYRLYDPCCGTGYLLAVIGFLHGGHISAISAADIDPRMVTLACRNLSLLSPDGLDARAAQLEALYRQHGRESHQAALTSAARLRTQLAPHIAIHCFTADATHPADLPPPVDLLITDVPYGRSKHWQGTAASVSALLDAQRPALRTGGLAAIVTPKDVPVQHPAYQRARRFSLGRRQITLLRLA